MKGGKAKKRESENDKTNIGFFYQTKIGFGSDTRHGVRVRFGKGKPGSDSVRRRVRFGFPIRTSCLLAARVFRWWLLLGFPLIPLYACAA